MVAAVALAAVVCGGMTRAACAQERSEHQYTQDFGLGVGAVFIDFLYMPVKFVYATLGGLTGGFAFVLTGGNFDVASSIWKPSLGGTYVITPSMLRGDEEIHFSGGGEEASRSRDETPRYEERRPREEPIEERGRPY
jgi:hypothetical protein